MATSRQTMQAHLDADTHDVSQGSLRRPKHLVWRSSLQELPASSSLLNRLRLTATEFSRFSSARVASWLPSVSPVISTSRSRRSCFSLVSCGVCVCTPWNHRDPLGAGAPLQVSCQRRHLQLVGIPDLISLAYLQ